MAADVSVASFVISHQIDPWAVRMVILRVSVLNGIQAKIRRREYEFSKHAVDQSIIRDIMVTEIEEAILSYGEIIEDYPDDKYGPSCLVLGFTKTGRALHLQCSYPVRPVIKIVTVYEPDPGLWVNFRTRRAVRGGFGNDRDNG